MRTANFFSAHTVILSVLLSLAACGGGGDGSSPSGTTGITTITGSLYAAPVSGASVTAKDAGGNTIAGPVSTAPDGTFSVNIPTSSLASDLIIESAGGTFKDEATGSSTAAGKLSAYVVGGSLKAGSSVNIDPSSTIVHDLVTKYAKTVAGANSIFNAAFGYTPDTSVCPKNTALSTSDNDTAARLAFLRAASFSQLTKDAGLAADKQFALIAAIAQDLSDGVLDGKKDNTSVTVGTYSLDDVQCKFNHALATFQKDNTTNMTGMTPDKIGDLSFGKIALTDTYKIQYVPGMMAASQGKTTFKIKVAKRSDGSAATGLSVSLMPAMHMATMSHSAPVDTVTEDSANPGAYNCTVYYLMASGAGLGYWELKVTLGGMSGEAAFFYPPVGMPMGTTTVRATLKGQNDKISTGNRTYYLFNDGGATASTFKLFIAAQESMMSYPAVYAGATLHDASNTAWSVNSMSVSASTDNSTWFTATNSGGGHWTVSGLSGLASGRAGEVYIKLSVNGEQKTTDGNVPSGPNASAVFTVTP